MLHVACKYGYQDIAEMLLDADADPNAVDGWAQQSAPA
jgi:ankyrin repeat protein